MPETSEDQASFDVQLYQFKVAEAVDQFMTDRRSRKYSAYTIHYYRVELGLFQAFLSQQNLQTFTDLDKTILRDFVLNLEERRNPGGCLASYRAVKTFLRWVWFSNEEY